MVLIPKARLRLKRVASSAELWFLSSLEMTAGDIPVLFEISPMVNPSRFRSSRTIEKSYIFSGMRFVFADRLTAIIFLQQ